MPITLVELVKVTFTQFTDSNANLFQRHPCKYTQREKVLPVTWASLSPTS